MVLLVLRFRLFQALTKSPSKPPILNKPARNRSRFQFICVFYVFPSKRDVKTAVSDTFRTPRKAIIIKVPRFALRLGTYSN